MCSTHPQRPAAALSNPSKHWSVAGWTLPLEINVTDMERHADLHAVVRVQHVSLESQFGESMTLLALELTCRTALRAD